MTFRGIGFRIAGDFLIIEATRSRLNALMSPDSLTWSLPRSRGMRGSGSASSRPGLDDSLPSKNTILVWTSDMRISFKFIACLSLFMFTSGCFGGSEKLSELQPVVDERGIVTYRIATPALSCRPRWEALLPTRSRTDGTGQCGKPAAGPGSLSGDEAKSPGASAAATRTGRGRTSVSGHEENPPGGPGAGSKAEEGGC